MQHLSTQEAMLTIDSRAPFSVMTTMGVVDFRCRSKELGQSGWHGRAIRFAQLRSKIIDYRPSSQYGIDTAMVGTILTIIVESD
jgi:hypothetical protein